MIDVLDRSCYNINMENKNKDRDFNVKAFDIVQRATGQAPEPEKSDKNPAAVALGRLGGLKGGMARKEKLSPERRKEIAQKAARTRWGKA